MNDASTAVLQGHLERALTGDPEARQQLLKVGRERLMRHARRFLHGTLPSPSLLVRVSKRKNDSTIAPGSPGKVFDLLW